MAEAEDGVTHRGYRVVGRVQGVGFRWWTRRTATALGLGGWVRNEPDGSVMVQVVGPEAVLDALEVALRKGPLGARVDRLEEIPAQGSGAGADFRIEA